MRLIDADALKEEVNKKKVVGRFNTLLLIDNAPTLGYEDGILSVETATRRAIELEDAYNNGWSDGFSEGENERPQYILKVKNLTAEDKKHFQECWNKSAGGLLAIPDNYEIIPIERPKGEWIFHKDYNESCRYGCNQCGNLNNIPSNFCPNCGADMRGDKE